MRIGWLIFLLFSGLSAGQILAGPIAVEVMLPMTAVDIEGDRNIFANSFDYRNGQLFTAHVEPPESVGISGLNLLTVVRKGVRQLDGQWSWEAYTLDRHTLNDPWHTQASIALDQEGFVHVAYNMHNMPWQYSVSERPFDIVSLAFRGQSITLTDRMAVKLLNKTNFPSVGTADIPGNQITYPMFFSDSTGVLYLTYRFSLRPWAPWDQRAFAGAIAKFDMARREWKQIGGPVKFGFGVAERQQVSGSVKYRPFAFQDGYSVYLITLGFDERNGIHAFWSWRDRGAGMNTSRPSYAYSPDGIHFFRSDGQEYPLPIDIESVEVVAEIPPAQEFYAPKSVAVLPDGKPAVILHPISGGRTLVYFDTAAGRWSELELMPEGASEIVVDYFGRLWAFSSGLRVFMRPTIKEKWSDMGSIGENLCFPKVKYAAVERRFIVHAKTCDGAKVTIVSFRH